MPRNAKHDCDFGRTFFIQPGKRTGQSMSRICFIISRLNCLKSISVLKYLYRLPLWPDRSIRCPHVTLVLHNKTFWTSNIISYSKLYQYYFIECLDTKIKQQQQNSTLYIPI